MHSICNMVEDLAKMTKSKETNQGSSIGALETAQHQFKAEIEELSNDLVQLRKVTADVSNGMKMLVEVWQ